MRLGSVIFILICSNISFSSNQEKINIKIFFSKKLANYNPKGKLLIGQCLFGEKILRESCERKLKKDDQTIILNIEASGSGCPLIKGGLILLKKDHKIQTIIEKIKTERPDLNSCFFRLFKEHGGTELKKDYTLSYYGIKNKDRIVALAKKSVLSFVKKYITNIKLSKSTHAPNIIQYDVKEFSEYKKILYQALEQDEFGLDDGKILSQKDALQSEKSNRAASYFDFIDCLTLFLIDSKAPKFFLYGQTIFLNEQEIIDLPQKISFKERERHQRSLWDLFDDWIESTPNGEDSI